jgi:hypothetical protein
MHMRNNETSFTSRFYLSLMSLKFADPLLHFNCLSSPQNGSDSRAAYSGCRFCFAVDANSLWAARTLVQFSHQVNKEITRSK